MRLMRSLERGTVADLVVALVLLAVSVQRARFFLFPTDLERPKQIDLYGSSADLRLHTILWWSAAVGSAVALVLRRRLPLAAFLLAAVSAGVLIADENVPQSPMAIAAAITLYTLAASTRSRRVGVVALAVALVGVLVLAGRREEALASSRLADAWWGPVLSGAAVPALLLGLAWAVGDAARTRRLHLAALEDRADGLQREQEQRASLAAADERARITRELHDVVAHGISVMVVQAQAAAAAIHTRPERSLQALDHVVATGRSSLSEMRRLLGLVRGEAETAELAPQPRLAAVPALLDEARHAGTPVTLRIEGEPVPLPATVDLSAYRIVQEALTNTRKHAGPETAVDVRLVFRAAWLEIDVSDEGPPRAHPVEGEGTGLRGIAERVGALGGRLDAGPRVDGGFSLRATLPLTAP